MKCIHLVWVITIVPAAGITQGTSCSNATPLALDGVYRTFPVSSATGPSEFCTIAGYSGNNGHVSFFQFTTNASAQCMTFDIATATPITVEVILYSGCSTGIAQPVGGLTQQSMCMPTGSGIWAPNLFDNLLPNTTYYLKIRTGNNYVGDIQIGAKFYSPQNDNCEGAKPISGTPVVDNNACHTPGPSVAASTLCATTLENTAWYTYTVQNSGSTTISITDIACNNGDGNSNNGFQIGFFKGSCGNLIPVTCSNGAGGVVQSTATGLTAGDKIYVAIDGYSGSNCSYSISASNALALPVILKSFTAKHNGNTNTLTWIASEEVDHQYYEVERSADGLKYEVIKRIPALEPGREKKYAMEDISPPQKSFYRLRYTDLRGRISYSFIIEVNRKASTLSDVRFIINKNNGLYLKIQSGVTTQLRISIINTSGQVLFDDVTKIVNGTNLYEKGMLNVKGKCFLVLTTAEDKKVIHFAN